MSWDDRFEDHVPGLRTLRNGADYIQRLPETERLYYARKETHWGKRKLKRDL